MPSTDDPRVRLGAFLTGSEAEEMADRLDDGDTLTAALRSIPEGRRAEVRTLLLTAGLGGDQRNDIVGVLRAIQGARSTVTAIDPLWTMPGHLAQGGPLTSSVTRLIEGARQAVTCSTFNFQRSSSFWSALGAAADLPGMAVRVYVDARAADGAATSGTPTTAEVAMHLRRAAVFRTRQFDGAYVRNHAKFLAVDHRFLLVTSANFSWSAEHGNVEFGVVIDNSPLTESVEHELREAEDALYERVRSH